MLRWPDVLLTFTDKSERNGKKTASGYHNVWFWISKGIPVVEMTILLYGKTDLLVDSLGAPRL